MSPLKKQTALSGAALRRRSLGEEVTQLIRRRILSGEVGHGQRLVEVGLAQELGISRTPVREALHRLAQESLLIKRPRGGYVVRPLTPQEVEEAVGVRAVLEGYAARLAAEAGDKAMIQRLIENVDGFQRALDARDESQLIALNTSFHHLLHEAAGHTLLSRLLGEVEDVVERISRALISNMGAGHWSTTEHRQLTEAIAEGRADDAARLAEEHVKRGGQWIVGQMLAQKLEV